MSPDAKTFNKRIQNVYIIHQYYGPEMAREGIYAQFLLPRSVGNQPVQFGNYNPNRIVPGMPASLTLNSTFTLPLTVGH